MKVSSMSRKFSISARHSGFMTCAERPALVLPGADAFRLPLCFAFVMFVRFLVSQKKDGGPSSFSYDKPRGRVSSRAGERTKKVPLFGALKDKIKFIASDFDEPLADFAEYM